jgi:hypothetical protein
MGMSLMDIIVGPLFKIIDKVLPDPQAKAELQLKILQMQQQGEFKELDAELASNKAQTDINLEEAKSPSFFKSGARPGLMWVGVIGMFYQWLVVPMASFIYTTHNGHPLPVPPPVIDPNLFLTLSGLLGLHIAGRSYEKVKGVA